MKLGNGVLDKIYFVVVTRVRANFITEQVDRRSSNTTGREQWRGERLPRISLLSDSIRRQMMEEE